MKTLRWFTIVLLGILVLSSWEPAPAYAKPSPASVANQIVDLAKTRLARLRVNNRTGRTLYVTFTGSHSYSFSTSNQGKTTFDSVIEPGNIRRQSARLLVAAP